MRDETWQQLIKAYTGFGGFSQEGLEEVLQNVLEEKPIGKGVVLKKLEFGFRELIDKTKQDKIRKRLEEVKNFDFGEVVQAALKYLPSNTNMDIHIHFTIDAFNTGMFRDDRVFLDIVRVEPSKINPEYLSHEFHHRGAEFWFKKNSRIEFLLNSKDPRLKLLGQALKYLVSEGLANAFCSPDYVHGKHPRVKELRENRIKWFEQLLNLFQGLTAPTEEISHLKDMYNKITTDPEGFLPPGHFLSGIMVSEMEESSEVSREEIINLPKNPENFIHLYNQATKTSGQLVFPSTLVQQVMTIFD